MKNAIQLSITPFNFVYSQIPTISVFLPNDTELAGLFAAKGRFFFLHFYISEGPLQW